MPDPDVHTYVCAQMPAKDDPPQKWVDHYLWSADVYAEHGMDHFAASMRYRAKLWQREC
jgi:hypothetical protein